MTTRIDYLSILNRKERFFVVGAALSNPTYRLGATFRQQLNTAFDLSVPADAFAAMDYRLDWIYAALHVSEAGGNVQGAHSNAEGLVSGKQEDVDLLVAFESDASTHIIMLGAKAMTGWTNKQAG